MLFPFTRSGCGVALSRRLVASLPFHLEVDVADGFGVG